MLDEDLLEGARLDELLLEDIRLDPTLEESLLDDDLLDIGKADELVETVPQAPKSLQAFAHAQPTPGSYGPPTVHHPPTVQENARLLFLTIWPVV